MVNFGAIAHDIEVCFVKSFVSSPEFVGIVNITRDSFLDGDLYYDKDKVIMHAIQPLYDGASTIELGAQSTKLILL